MRGETLDADARRAAEDICRDLDALALNPRGRASHVFFRCLANNVAVLERAMR
jgi:hypothetical protein